MSAAHTPVESPTRRIRVCLVGPSLKIVGGQAVILQRLRARLETVPGLLITFLPVNPDLPGVLGALQRIKYVRTVVTSVAYVWSLLRTLRHVDVVHAFSASYWSFLLAPVPALVVARLFRIPSILNYRSGEASDHLATWKSASFFTRWASAVVVPSGYLVEVFARFGHSAHAVANFVEMDHIAYRERLQLTPRFFGNRNLEPMYNVACVVRAFAKIQALRPDASLVLAGDGSERASLTTLVAELGLNHVQFIGRISPADMSRWYHESDVYLNAPDIDNMPNSVIEAFAAGLPVVTTNAGGIPFVVRHDDNGLMVACGDHQALATQALRLFHEPHLAQRLADRARADVLDRYTWTAVQAQWVRLYQQLAQRSSVPAPTRAAPSR